MKQACKHRFIYKPASCFVATSLCKQGYRLTKSPLHLKGLDENKLTISFRSCYCFLHSAILLNPPEVQIDLHQNSEDSQGEYNGQDDIWAVESGPSA